MDPFLAEIRMFPFNFPPKGWAFCNGQLLPLSQNTALFALLGTFYGGDGKSTFALPDLQDSVPVHVSNTNEFPLGALGGSETVTLLESEIPFHTHFVNSSVEDGTQGSLVQGVTIASSAGGALYQSTTNANIVPMNVSAISPAGGDLPHHNLMPYLVVNFCIALQGVFPQRQ